MSGLTLTEKIIGLHLAPGSHAPGAPPPRQGDFVLVRPRRILTHDNSAAVIPKFNALFAGEDAAPARTPSIFDPFQPVLALDHDIQNLTSDNLARYATIERFARAHNLPFHRAGSGIGHQLMLEQGHVLPGTLVVASDSHANAYGALGALGLPVVRTDAAVIWATGSTWWHIPPVINVHLTNALSPGVTGKDAIIALCSRFPTEVQNAAAEFTGPGLRTLSISDRMAIANMTTEWGAIACVMQSDQSVADYLASRSIPALPQPQTSRPMPTPATPEPSRLISRPSNPPSQAPIAPITRRRVRTRGTAHPHRCCLPALVRERAPPRPRASRGRGSRATHPPPRHLLYRRSVRRHPARGRGPRHLADAPRIGRNPAPQRLRPLHRTRLGHAQAQPDRHLRHQPQLSRTHG
jgi:hypothetical protein